MSYTRKNWADDEIIEVNELNHIEEGLAEAHATIASIQSTLLKTTLDRYNIYEDIEIVASGVDTSITDVDVTYSNAYSVQVSYTGSASQIEVAIFCANDGFEYSVTAVGVMNLSQELNNDIIFLESNYDKVKLRITNKDSVNSATVDVAIKILTSTGTMSVSSYDTNEDGSVDEADLAGKLDDGSNGKTYSDISSEIDSDILAHKNNASAHHTRYTDSEAQAAINADSDHGSTAPHNYRTDEEIRDVAAAMLVAGDNVLLTFNDDSNTVTISSSGLSPDQLTKLNGIEAGATADMTAAEIVALINASTSVIDADNVNVTAGSGTGLTTEQLEKFNSIEYGATADQTATEIVTLINSSSEKINAANLTLGSLATVIERGFVGEVVAGDTLRIYIPKTATLQSVTVISATQPISESCIVDVRKNGTATTNSIFQNDTPAVLTTSATATNGVYTVNGTLDSALTSLAAGDVLRVYVTQSGNVVDLSVCLQVVF